MSNKFSKYLSNLMKKRFWTGLIMQLVQASAIIGFGLYNLDWSWFSVRYLIVGAVAFVIVAYNLFSFFLIFWGLKGGKN